MPKTKEPADGRTSESEYKTCFLGHSHPHQITLPSPVHSLHPHRVTCAASADAGSPRLKGSGVEGHSGHTLRHYLFFLGTKPKTLHASSQATHVLLYSSTKAQAWLMSPFHSVCTSLQVPVCQCCPRAPGPGVPYRSTLSVSNYARCPANLLTNCPFILVTSLLLTVLLHSKPWLKTTPNQRSRHYLNGPHLNTLK